MPAELSNAFKDAVDSSDGDKTSWLVDAIRQKLNRPESNPNARMMALVERMEMAAAALIVGKQGVPGLPYDEGAVIRIVGRLSSRALTMAVSSQSGLTKLVIRQKRVKLGQRTFTVHGNGR